MTGAVWLTAREAAALARCDVSTITRDAAAGRLHGHQKPDAQGRPIPKSRWKFPADVINAYVGGQDEPTQKQRCPACPALRALRRTG